MTTTLPKPNPIPAGISKAKIGQWRYCLLGLMDCFEHKGDDAPDWLIDAIYDLTFDPESQAVLERTMGVEPS